jgi:Ankyrin repeats (3 copies)
MKITQQVSFIGLVTLVSSVWSNAWYNVALPTSTTLMTGETALHRAIARGHVKVVQYLVQDCSASIHAIDKHGHTPLSRARLNENFAVVEYRNAKQRE